MTFSGCKESSYWDGAESTRELSQDMLGLDRVHRSILSQPIRAYSKRSAKINDLREGVRQAPDDDIPEVMPPSKNALAGAEHFINLLPEGCLDFVLAVSHSGEINLFFGDQGNPLQIFFDARGLISYYGKFGDVEFTGDEVSAHDFQYMKLLHLLGVN